MDRWTDGQIYCQKLPKDYLEKSIRIKEFSRILLRALHPLDIVVTKIGRLNQRDIQDIEACIREFKISKAEIKARAYWWFKLMLDPEEDYLSHLDWVLEKFFTK